MTYPPLSKWKCDKCHTLIETAQEGYTTWRDDDQGRPTGFKIVHQGACDTRLDASSVALPGFLGADGMAHLTSLLTYGPLRSDGGHRGVADIDEFMDFFRRLQLPYYEEARPNFSHHDVIDEYRDATEVRPYLEDALKDIASR